jgi:hypothetical protein
MLTSGATSLGALVTAILTYLGQRKTAAASRKIVLKARDGTTVEIPAGLPEDEVEKWVERAKSGYGRLPGMMACYRACSLSFDISLNVVRRARGMGTGGVFWELSKAPGVSGIDPEGADPDSSEDIRVTRAPHLTT